MNNAPQLVARIPSSSQVIVLKYDVLNYVARYKQDTRYKFEAGGQLFCSISEFGIEIIRATGPYHGDKRSRFSYRSDPLKAQHEIFKQRKRGLYYCGDWHTHPEPIPSASQEDLETIATVVQRSEVRLSSLVMLIQGTSDGPAGIAVYSSDGGLPIKWIV